VELLDGRPGDLVQPEWFSAVVAGGVAVAVGDDGFPSFRGQPACRLDGVDVDELLLAGPGIKLADTVAGGLALAGFKLRDDVLDAGKIF